MGGVGERMVFGWGMPNAPTASNYSYIHILLQMCCNLEICVIYKWISYENAVVLMCVRVGVRVYSCDVRPVKSIYGTRFVMKGMFIT